MSDPEKKSSARREESLPHDNPKTGAAAAEPQHDASEFIETERFNSDVLEPSKQLEPIVVSSGDASKRTGDQQHPKSVGRYEIRRILGKGGFGAVYLGYDPQLNREVAIKVPHLGSHGDVEKEFLQEARQLAQLKHPGIVTVYDVGIDRGRCYIVSDFLSGQTLSKWLRDHQLTWQEAVRISAALADALAHAHAQRTVHRDLKPGNVILKDGRDPVLVDFGLAVSDVPAATQQRGVISGTPAYMSPEQARGAGHRIDGRTDIYSLGVILYRMLTGVLPFRATDVRELLRQVCEDDPQPPRQLIPSLPRELEHICLKAMARKHSNRYTTASDMAEDLRQVARQYDPAAALSVSPPIASGIASTAPPTAKLNEPAPHIPSSPPASREFSSNDQPSSVRRVREAARRHVTVMTCSYDVFESDESLESLDDEEQHKAMVQFQELCTKITQEFDGTVVQTTDQGLLVCFGFPLAFEDAAQRAVYSALRILREMPPVNEWWRRYRGVTLSTRLAIHSGLAVVEDTGVGEVSAALSVTGQVRSVATKLESIAEPNTVVVSSSTHRLVKSVFDFESLGAQTIKGVPGKTEVFRVVR